MGFNFDNDKPNNKQMSLFDFQMPKADFVQSENTAVDFDMWLMAHKESEPTKIPRFITISAAVHALAILAIAVMTVPLVETAKTETITIEIEEPPAPIKAPRGKPVPATKGGTQVAKSTPIVEKIDEVGGPGDVIVSKPAQKKSMPKARVVKAPAQAPAKASMKAAPVKAARSIAPRAPVKAVPLTIDDIEAPELDQGELANVAVASNLNEDFNDDFEHIDRSQKAALENERRSMEAMAAALAEEQDKSLDALDEINKNEAERFAAAQNALREKNAQAIASALAAEKAAAAREAAARKAAAKRSGLGGTGTGYGSANGGGAGNSGSLASGKQLAGMPNGVRSLDQLRQMPGNPRPQYDREERRRGDQGEIAFIAYISKEGYPMKFRMTKSTGFKNLDEKTLEALKKWRFYPGQEGWVELPFRWDLKGGVQEDGGRLRVSRR